MSFTVTLVLALTFASVVLAGSEIMPSHERRMGQVHRILSAANPMAVVMKNHGEKLSMLTHAISQRQQTVTQVSKGCQNALQSAQSNPCYTSLQDSNDGSGTGSGTGTGDYSAAFGTYTDLLCNPKCLNMIDGIFSACASDFDMTKEEVSELEGNLTAAANMICVKDPNTGKLCIDELVDSEGNLPVQFDDPSTITNANLQKLCVPCFFLLFNNIVQYSSTMSGDNTSPSGGISLSLEVEDAAVIAAVCMMDPTAADQPSYCLPYINNTPDCADIDADATCETEYASYVCSSTCHTRMLSVYFYFDSQDLTADEITNAETTIDYLCTQNPTNGDYCIADWTQFQSATSNLIAGGCDVYDACADCSADVATVFENLGCCFETGYDTLYSLSSAAGQESLYSWYNALLDSSCSPPADVTTACPIHGGTITTGTMTVTLDIDCDYFNANQADAEAALKQDFAINSGVLSADLIEGFSATCSNSRGKQTMKVSGSTQGNNNQQTTNIKNTVTKSDGTSFYLGTYNTKSGSYYKSKNGSAALAPSIVMLLLSLLVALM